MQQLEFRPRPAQQPNNAGAPRSQIILIFALLLFSIAGLASGFSIGALSKKTGQTKQPSQITSNVPSLKGQSATPVPKTITKIIPLGCPIVMPNSSVNLTNAQLTNNTTYTFSTQAVDTTGNQPTKKIYCATANKPIHTAGITFKLWVIKNVGNKTLTFPNLGDITKPIDGKVNGKDFPELQNELQFGTTTPQVQQSNAQGQVTWNYTLNPGLKDGTYTLVVLTNWQGKTANWTWRDLVVKKQA